MLTIIDPPILILAIVFVSMVVTFALVRIHIHAKTGRRVAEVEVHPGSEWSLAFITEPGRKYNLCLSFRIEHPGGEDDFGLIADYTCIMSGRTVISEKAAIGHTVPPEQVRRIGTQYNVSLTSVGGWTRYRATVVLCGTDQAEERAEIRASGRLTASSGVEIEKAVVFFSGAG